MSAGGEPRLTAVRDAPLGGQAVLEGVMMRGVRHWAVAVREPPPEPGSAAAPEPDAAAPPEAAAPSNGHELSPVRELAEALEVSEHAGEHPLGKISVRRFGLTSWTKRRRIYRLPVIRGVVALVESLGIGLRALSISASAQLPEEEGEISGGAWFGTVLVSVVFAIGLFFVVPVGLTSLIKGELGSSLLFWLVEGILRTTIFLGYLLLLSRIPDLRRVFEYHGAEHKVISCYEAAD